MRKEKFKISRLGLGGVQFGMDYGFSKALEQDEVNEILRVAHEKDINFLDTARAYGDSETKIGNYLQKNPGHFSVCTKLEALTAETAKYEDKIERSITESIEASQKALGNGYLPIFLLHQTDRFIVENDKFWSVLKRIKELRGFRFGISVYDPESTIDILAKYGDMIDCVQAPYNVVDRRFESLAGILRDKKIVFISRSTFLKGALVEKKIPAELKGLEPVRMRLNELSRESGLSVAQLLMCFALNAPLIDCTLIGVGSVEQLRDSLDSYDSHSQERFHRFQDKLADISVKDPFLVDPRQWKSL